VLLRHAQSLVAIEVPNLEQQRTGDSQLDGDH
jgi:hypothetical protein